MLATIFVELLVPSPLGEPPTAISFRTVYSCKAEFILQVLNQKSPSTQPNPIHHHHEKVTTHLMGVAILTPEVYTKPQRKNMLLLC